MNLFQKLTAPNDHIEHPDPDWEREGVKILKNFIPTAALDEYLDERKNLIGGTPLWRPGWPDPIPYMRVQSMMNLATFRPLTREIAKLIGEEPGLHLCLTGFQSTERAWHQDRYLNPEDVGERYIAAWIAVDDVHPDSGPFEYVAGSHRWPVIERRLVWQEMADRGVPFSHATWPTDSQGFVGDACADEALLRGAEITQFVPKKGDVLLWHASLIHRGSKPKNPNLERRALISHYSGIRSRPDMPKPAERSNGSFVFLFGNG